jgi:hypothetical protein
MLEISTSGLMSGDGKRSGLFRAQPPRPSSTLLKQRGIQRLAVCINFIFMKLRIARFCRGQARRS